MSFFKLITEKFSAAEKIAKIETVKTKTRLLEEAHILEAEPANTYVKIAQIQKSLSSTEFKQIADRVDKPILNPKIWRETEAKLAAEDVKIKGILHLYILVFLSHPSRFFVMSF